MAGAYTAPRHRLSSSRLDPVAFRIEGAAFDW
jgi:hypothetical protein